MRDLSNIQPDNKKSRRWSGLFFLYLVDTVTKAYHVKLKNLMVQQKIQALAFANHLSPAIKQNFPDSKIAQNDACEKTQTICILNGALVPFHQGIFSKRNGEIGLMLCFLHWHRRIRRLGIGKNESHHSLYL